MYLNDLILREVKENELICLFKPGLNSTSPQLFLDMLALLEHIPFQRIQIICSYNEFYIILFLLTLKMRVTCWSSGNVVIFS